MGFFPVQQFQMKIATAFIGKCLEELPRQPESKGRRGILRFFPRRDLLVGGRFQAAPHQMRASAKIDDAPRKAFIHWHIRLAGEGVARVEPGAVTADAFFITQSLDESGAEDKPTIFDRVMRIDFEVALTAQLQIHDRVFREQGQHMIEKRDACFHGRFPAAIQLRLSAAVMRVSRRFSAEAVDFCLTISSFTRIKAFSGIQTENKAQICGAAPIEYAPHPGLYFYYERRRL